MIDPIIYALNYTRAQGPSIAFPDPTAWNAHTIDGISIDAPTPTEPRLPYADGVRDFDSSGM
jgi:hypothetical protein